jgi:hypothetical protein
MRHIPGFVVLVFAAVACAPSGSESTAADGEKDKGKGIIVTLDGLKSQVPGDWKEEAPANRMRLMQFRLPKKGDDKDDAELVIFKGISGDAKANVKRWKEQFVPPEGKKIDEVAKVAEIKIGGNPATYLDVKGTYLFKAQPFNPNAKTEQKVNYRMVAIHFEGPKDIYHLKLTGPAKTIEAYKKGFDDWLKNFK